MTTELVLGEQYTDRYSGVTGAAMEAWAYLNGCYHITLQPKPGEDGKRVETEYSYDVYLDNAAGEPVTHPQWMADRAAEILGKRYRDTVSGFEGTATGVRFMLNGTEQASLQPRGTRANELPSSYSMDIAKLEEIPDPVPARTLARTGGPDTQAPRP